MADEGISGDARSHREQTSLRFLLRLVNWSQGGLKDRLELLETDFSPDHRASLNAHCKLLKNMNSFVHWAANQVSIEAEQAGPLVQSNAPFTGALVRIMDELLREADSWHGLENRDLYDLLKLRVGHALTNVCELESTLQSTLSMN